MAGYRSKTATRRPLKGAGRLVWVSFAVLPVLGILMAADTHGDDSQPVPQSTAAEPDSTRVAVFSQSALEASRAELGRPYLPFLTTPTLRAGLYELGAGADDGQQPHDKDELYYVLAGSATLFADGERRPVQTGDVVFIAAHVEHRFEDITDDLSLLVFFSEAEPQ